MTVPLTKHPGTYVKYILRPHSKISNLNEKRKFYFIKADFLSKENVIFCLMCYNFYNLKKVKNTHGGIVQRILS